jgi:hypothetical protein
MLLKIRDAVNKRGKNEVMDNPSLKRRIILGMQGQGTQLPRHYFLGTHHPAMHHSGMHHPGTHHPETQSSGTQLHGTFFSVLCVNAKQPLQGCHDVALPLQHCRRSQRRQSHWNRSPRSQSWSRMCSALGIFTEGRLFRIHANRSSTVHLFFFHQFFNSRLNKVQNREFFYLVWQARIFFTYSTFCTFKSPCFLSTSSSLV